MWGGGANPDGSETWEANGVNPDCWCIGMKPDEAVGTLCLGARPDIWYVGEAASCGSCW